MAPINRIGYKGNSTLISSLLFVNNNVKAKMHKERKKG
jgi:hypothetical protein